jgi:hypothetical protein
MISVSGKPLKMIARHGKRVRWRTYFSVQPAANPNSQWALSFSWL